MKLNVRDKQVYNMGWMELLQKSETVIHDMYANMLVLMPLLFPDKSDNFPQDKFFLDE